MNILKSKIKKRNLAYVNINTETLLEKPCQQFWQKSGEKNMWFGQSKFCRRGKAEKKEFPNWSVNMKDFTKTIDMSAHSLLYFKLFDINSEKKKL